MNQRLRIQNGIHSLIVARGELDKDDVMEILVGVHHLSLNTAERYLREMRFRGLITSDSDGFVRPRG